METADSADREFAVPAIPVGFLIPHLPSEGAELIGQDGAGDHLRRYSRIRCLFGMKFRILTPSGLPTYILRF
jgi:hypothetical protein